MGIYLPLRQIGILMTITVFSGTLFVNYKTWLTMFLNFLIIYMNIKNRVTNFVLPFSGISFILSHAC